MSAHAVPPRGSGGKGSGCAARALLGMLQRQPGTRSAPGQGSPAAGRRAGRQAAGHGQCQVPGHCHHGYLHSHRPPHRRPLLLRGAGAHRLFTQALQGGCIRAKTNKTPSLLVLTYASKSPMDPGRGPDPGTGPATQPPQGPEAPTGRGQAGAGTQLDQRNRGAFGPGHTTNAEGTRLQPMKKLWQDRKRTA